MVHGLSGIDVQIGGRVRGVRRLTRLAASTTSTCSSLAGATFDRSLKNPIPSLPIDMVEIQFHIMNTERPRQSGPSRQ